MKSTYILGIGVIVVVILLISINSRRELFNAPYGCPPGWSQEYEDSDNGSCKAPCSPGNNSPASFNYGPDHGGYPLNRRSGNDYCIDASHSNRTGDFEIKSDTVGGPPNREPVIPPTPASSRSGVGWNL